MQRKSNTENAKIKQSSSRANLYITTFIVNLSAFAIGNIFSWSSPSLPKLEAADSWLSVDTIQASWIGSLTSLGAGLSPFLGGWLVDLVGRRPTIVFSVVLALASWIILYPAQSVWVIYVARLVGGFGCGMVFMSVPLYLGEIADDSVRSALTTLFGFSVKAGLVFEYIVGPYVTFWTLILSSCAAPVLFFVLSSWAPESPYYLLLKSKEKEAFITLSWLRKGCGDTQVFEELTKVKREITIAAKNKGTILDLVRVPKNRKALLLACGCVGVMQFCGINVVQAYAQNIFQLAGVTALGTSKSTILFGVMLLAATGVAVPLTHRFGLRLMLAVSAAGMSFFMALLGTYLFLRQEGLTSSSYNWFPLMSLVGYVIFFAVGFGSGTFAVAAEVFQPNVKGKASAVAASVDLLISFALTNSFPTVVAHLGLYVVFWAFAVFSALGCVFVLSLLPDTRGLSLQQIQDILDNRTNRGDLEAAERTEQATVVENGR